MSNQQYIDSLIGQNNPQGLGWIGILISAVASLAPLVIDAFKKPPVDQWSSWDDQTKETYVRQGLKVAVNAVLTGKATSLEQVLQPIIARVELDEDWPTWKNRNPFAVHLIQQANNELAMAKQGNYSTHFEFVDKSNLPMLHAGMLSASTFTWVIIGMLLAGGIVYGLKTNLIKH